MWSTDETWCWIVEPFFVPCFGIGVDVCRLGVLFPPLDLEVVKTVNEGHTR